MEDKKAAKKKDSWLKVLLSYTEGSGRRLGISDAGSWTVLL